MITEGEEKYVRLLYNLRAYKGRLVSTTRVARELRVSPPTAVEALKKLEKKGLICYVERRGVCLSGEGLRVALKILRFHRILEVALCKVSDLSVEEVCEGVKGVELKFQEDFIERLYNSLGKPKYCPHGKLIPSIKS